MENTNNRKKPAISAKRMIIPAVIAMLIMHALIVFNTVRINNMGQVISQYTQRNFALAGMSNGISQLTDQLTGTAMRYVNTGDEDTLKTYFEQLGNMQGSYAAMQELIRSGSEAEQGAAHHPHMSADAAPENSAAGYLSASTDAVMERAQTEMTAMRLAAQSRGTDLSTWPQLQSMELPQELEKLPDGAKIGKAHELLADSAYQSTRGDVQRNLSIAASTAHDENVASIQRLSNVLSLYRLQQWVLMALIIGTMLVMIVLLFTKLLIPLEKSVEHVQKGESLPREYGFSELRRLAESYDDLMEHRNKLEEDLRELSHTDALTGLPNRLAYEEFLKKLLDTPEHTSLTIYSMDVDGLKVTNDKLGHVSGDKLLREAASCILKTFGDSTGKNVFRTGGDEFVAIRLGDTEEQCRSALAAFRAEQESRGISISVGHAYLPDIRGEKLRQMFEEADHNMYEAKAERHRDAETHNT